MAKIFKKEIFKMNDFTENFFKKQIDTDTLRIMHKQQLMEFLQSMFVYENVPDSLDTNYLELYLNSHGIVIIGKLNNELLCMPAQLCGEIDNYNNGTTVFGVSPVGEIRGIINDDVRELKKECGFPGLKLYQFAFEDYC